MKSLKIRLVWGYVMLVVCVVLILGGVFLFTVRAYYYQSITQAIHERAEVSTNFYNKYLPNQSLREKATAVLENRSTENFTKIEIIDVDGMVIMDSNGFSSNKKINSPDVRTGLSGETSVWIGKDRLTKEKIIALSWPLQKHGQTEGVMRYTSSLREVDRVLMKITIATIGLGLLVIITAFAASLFMANRMIRPIRELTIIAEEMASGNFHRRARKRYPDEIGHLMDTMNYLSEELTRNERLKNEFISSITHELRTPLTSIKGWSETLYSGDLQDREETMIGLKVIADESNRLTGLVEDLLDFSKLHSGNMQMVQDPVDIRRLVKAVARQFNVTGKHKGVRVSQLLPNEPLEITGDENRMKQVFINLMDNSFKFTPRGGTIEIRAAKIEDEIQITIADSGVGISPDDLKFVTNKFYKGHTKQPGSGLGLSICQEIVRLHHGRMDVTSLVGKGTTVTLYIPALVKESAEAMSLYSTPSTLKEANH